MTEKKNYYSYYITLKSLPMNIYDHMSQNSKHNNDWQQLVRNNDYSKNNNNITPAGGRWRREKVDSNSKYKVTTTKKAYLQVLDGMPEQKPLLTCQSPPQSS